MEPRACTPSRQVRQLNGVCLARFARSAMRRPLASVSKPISAHGICCEKDAAFGSGMRARIPSRLHYET